MQLQVNRIKLLDHCTIGHFFVDNVRLYFSLEDKVRPDGVKIFGETAIPQGTYQVVLDYSERFGKDMPHILNVPMFDGIRIHPGNTDIDTHGCILIGMNTDAEERIMDSRVAFTDFMDNHFLPAINRNEEVQIKVLDA